MEGLELLRGRPSSPGSQHELPGLEPDNLLAFLALLGLLRSLERTRPDLQPRIAWRPDPWIASLSLSAEMDPGELAALASTGCEEIASEFDVDGRSNVSFERPEYRAFVERVADHPVQASLAMALAAELPEKRGGGVRAAPLVMMFGQGHQNFLDRLVAVPRGESPNRWKNRARAPDMRDPQGIHRALFEPWKRSDDADSFRWDPEEDQRYALRFGNPSKDGAALTVNGANRLAAIGLLSFPCAPGSRRLRVASARHEGAGQYSFVWPLWTVPLDLRGIEALLGHHSVIEGDIDKVRAYGVAEIMRARRVANGKFMNVSRALPFRRE